MSKEFCGCIPWDYMSPNDNGRQECDVFGRSCFALAMRNFSYSPPNTCICEEECDFMRYEKVIQKQELLSKGRVGGKYYKRDFGKVKYVLKKSLIF